jgi:hypothetical protein
MTFFQPVAKIAVAKKVRMAGGWPPIDGYAADMCFRLQFWL